MKAFTSYPKIQALHDLAKLSTQMKTGNQGEFKQINPEQTQQPTFHLEHNLTQPQGHATAEADASNNKEAFLSKMKNARLSRVKGIAF